MFGSVIRSWTIRAILVMAIGSVVALVTTRFDKLPNVSAREPSGKERGQYGGDLSLLQQFYTPPQAEGESNHYFDLSTPGSLPGLARVHGLTNIHTLFIDSHGKGGCSRSGSGYGFYPFEQLLAPNQKTPYYSARDVATVVGWENAAKIHSIVIAGCNEEGRFRSEEFRRYFLNATNIIYMEPGKLAYKPMFYQAIIKPSAEIQPLYGKTRITRSGRVECEIVDEPVRGAKRLGAYVADLYLPGASKPYRTQKAGRELLQPEMSGMAPLRVQVPEKLEDTSSGQ